MERVARRHSIAKSHRNRAVRPLLEGLEDRILLYATTGDHFTFGSRITWSIVPDGTSLGGIPSNLIATLNSELGSVYTWLPVVQDAFAEWENVSNINVSQVQDSGQPIASGNIQQDSPAFGDIRIGGYSQAANVLGFTLLPPAANGGSESGDVFLNTSLSWHIGSDYDLESVVLHEIGHALGMGHSASTNAVMYPYYSGVQTSPNTDDIAGIQSIWGPRQEDPFVQAFNNLSFANAANVTGFMVSASDQVYLPGLSVASQADTYWFKVTTPANSSNVFTAQVQSSGLSELSPLVAIYNTADVGLAKTSAPANAYSATIAASITNATPNTTYYVKVSGSNIGASGTGAYAMTLNMGPYAIATAPPPNTLVMVQPDQGGGAMLEKFGGSNTKSNTPADVPDKISIGSIKTKGDFMLVSPIKTHSAKHVATHINVPHPVHHTTEKPTKVRAKATHSAKK